TAGSQPHGTLSHLECALCPQSVLHRARGTLRDAARASDGRYCSSTHSVVCFARSGWDRQNPVGSGVYLSLCSLVLGSLLDWSRKYGHNPQQFSDHRRTLAVARKTICESSADCDSGTELARDPQSVAPGLG